MVNFQDPTLSTGFAYNTQNWLVMQPAGQDSSVKICSWLQVAARTRDPQGDTSLENKRRLFIELVRRQHPPTHFL
jgi:hypothetical protein